MSLIWNNTATHGSVNVTQSLHWMMITKDLLFRKVVIFINNDTCVDFHKHLKDRK